MAATGGGIQRGRLQPLIAFLTTDGTEFTDRMRSNETATQIAEYHPYYQRGNPTRAAKIIFGHKKHKRPQNSRQAAVWLRQFFVAFRVSRGNSDQAAGSKPPPKYFRPFLLLGLVGGTGDLKQWDSCSVWTMSRRPCHGQDCQTSQAYISPRHTLESRFQTEPVTG